MGTSRRNYLLLLHCSRIIEDGERARQDRDIHICTRHTHTRGTHAYMPGAFISDSPFAEGRSTNGSISSTNTDTGVRSPFRRGNDGSCILENIRTYFHYTHVEICRAVLCANFWRIQRAFPEAYYFSSIISERSYELLNIIVNSIAHTILM